MEEIKINELYINRELTRPIPVITETSNLSKFPKLEENGEKTKTENQF